MKFKKLTKYILTTTLIFGSLSVVSCCKKDNESVEKTEQEKTYNLYVQYTKAKGYTPLTYEQWLESIKGDKGDKGDKGNDAVAPQIRISETTNEWEVSNDNGVTWNSTGVKATITNGFNALYKQTIQSVVTVRVQRKTNSEIKSTASGVVAYEEGNYAYILTNSYAVKDLTNDFEVEILFSNSEGFLSGKSEIATVIGRDFNEDVAILQIHKSNKYEVSTLGDSSQIEKGDLIYTIGSLYHNFNNITSGIVSNYNVKIDIDTINSDISTPLYTILLDTQINSRNSGGGLFNEKGELIGITTELNGIYCALPINHFMKVARHLHSINSSYTRPTLNLTLLSVNEMGVLRENYGISTCITTGVYIQNSLESNIPSQSVITEVNGVDVESVTDYYVEILKYNVGDTVVLTLVNKDGLNMRQVNITLH